MRRALLVAALLGGAARVLALDPPVPCSGGPCWVPPVEGRWQWQLTRRVKLVRAPLFVLDWEESAETVARVHAAGRRAYCYVSAGSLETYRADAAAFPADVIGTVYEGYPDERWLDVRRLDVLVPIMAARMDACRAKGFDGVQLDNVDGWYEAETGFPLTQADQLAYNVALANAAHAKGLGAALENDLRDAPVIAAYFDWVIFELDRDENGACFYGAGCTAFDPWRAAGKAIMAVEYRARPRFCARARRLHVNGIRKRNALDAPVRFCR
jgi:hypothetical protein